MSFASIIMRFERVDGIEHNAGNTTVFEKYQ